MNLKDTNNFNVDLLDGKHAEDFSPKSHSHNTLSYTNLSGKTVSLNAYTLSSGSPHVSYYYCPTDGGGSNITGRPNDNYKNAFYLRVELLRYGSSTDYASMQTYVRYNEKIKYVRYCTSGTWSAWEKIYTSVQKPTPAEIGASPSSHNHSSISGNAATATTLQTARTINGTSFNGSANITTAGWGTTRTLTIGNAAKSVNGSANVSWSLSEIGAAPASHSHSYAPTSHTHDYITIKDIRDTAPTPDSFCGSKITTFFNNHSTYGGAWHSGITVAGWSSGYQVWQISGFSSTSDSEALYFRRGRGSTWGPLRKIYHEGQKPTPADIGAAPASHSHSYLPTSGGSISGDLELQNLNARKTMKIDNITFIKRESTTSGNMVMGAQGVDIEFEARYLYMRSLNDSSIKYKLYHEGNKPTAAAIGALPSSGGILTGNLTAPRFALDDIGGIGTQGNLSVLYGKGEVRIRPSGLGVGNYGIIANSTIASMCPEVSRQVSLGTSSNLWKEIWVGNYNKNLTGYCSLPNGMIMQWGYINGLSVAENRVTLPIAMSSNNYNVHVTEYSQIDVAKSVRVKAVTTTQIVIVPSSVMSVYWLVIGW